MIKYEELYNEVKELPALTELDELIENANLYK